MSWPNRICSGEFLNCSEKRLRYCEGWNFLRTLLIVVLRTVYARAYRIFLHEPGIERLETVSNESRFGDTRIQPEIIVLRFQDHGHTIVYVGHQRVGLRREDGACFQEFTTRT